METKHPRDILDRMETAKTFVAAWYNSHVAKTEQYVDDGSPIDYALVPAVPEIDEKTDVYIVWFCKTLQNWKALLSTTVDDGRYYEATYNGEKHELYLDVYRKEDNVTISEEIVDKNFPDSGYHTVPKMNTPPVRENTARQKTNGPWEFDDQGQPKPFTKVPGGDWDMHPDDVETDTK